MKDFPKLGDISSQEIIAPFEFQYNITDSTLQRRIKTILENTPIRLERNDTVGQHYIKKFESNWDSTKKILEADTTDEAKEHILANLWENLSNETIEFIMKTRDIKSLHTGILSRLKYYYDKGFVTNKNIHDTLKSDIFSLKKDRHTKQFISSQLITKEYALKQSYNSLLGFFENYKPKAKAARQFLEEYLHPNLKINEKFTLEKIRNKISSIDTIAGTVSKDEKIIGVHDKVTPEAHEKLQALEKKISTARRRENPYVFVLARVGNFLVILFTALLFFGFLYKFKRDQYNDIHQFYLILGLLLVEVVLGYIFYQLNIPLTLTPIPMLAILLSVLFNVNLAFAVILFSSVLIALFQGLSLQIFLFLTITGALASYLFRGIKDRMDFYKPMLYLLGPVIFLIFSLNLVHFADLGTIFYKIGFGALNVFLSPLIALLLLPAAEKLTGITTDLSLREYSHTDNPLLKQLSVEAPGTFHHSNIVSNLAENAAEAIEANSLVCKVTSLYHDVGKLSHPEYFNENQQAESRHTKLSPHMSFLVIKNHVKEGVKIAKANDLPPIIRDIIRQHHGTSAMEYFYKKAFKERENAEREDFKYPGPKPQTKEAGIVMLADATEAATRSLDNKSRKNIRNTVQDIIENKLSTDQLNSCNLTLKELDKIKEQFITILDGVYHQRQTEEE